MFFVAMEHPDGPAWDQHVKAHVDDLEELAAAGTLRASGPLENGRLRTGFLVFEAPDRATVTRFVAADPFTVHGVIRTVEIREWDPVFGVFAPTASGTMPGSS